MDTPAPISPASLGDFLIAGIRQIDLACNKLVNGIEGGLCDVERQFQAEALAETGLTLTEELLISWQLEKQLSASGLSVKREHRYPGSREECDLVITMANGNRFWVEVKNAWRHWFNPDGTSERSSAYRGYLFGDESHLGAAHDFEKLEQLRPTDAHWLGVLLIGFDSDKARMAGDIQELTDTKQLIARGWKIVASKRWADRRNANFGISTWFWSKEAGGNAPVSGRLA
jgi:hypothetical protein